MQTKSRLRYFAVISFVIIVFVSFYFATDFTTDFLSPISRKIAAAPSCKELFYEYGLANPPNIFSVDRLNYLTGNFKAPNGTPVVSYQAPDHSYFYVVDMARVPNNSIFAMAANRYLTNKNRALVRRVPKFRDDPDALAKLEITDEMIRQRSIIVLNTASPIEEVLPEENDFLGGARVVISDSAKVPLPFQLVQKADASTPESPADFWLRTFDRPNQPSAEIGALTAKTDKNPWRTTELVNLCAQLVLNLNVTNVYIHTGIFQAALYGKMHLHPAVVKTFDRKNVILQYDSTQHWPVHHMNTIRPAFNSNATDGAKPNQGPPPNE